MAAINKVFIMGNLGQDPELRYTPNQIPVVTLNVATTEVWNNKAGEKQENTEWHRIVVWGKQAENCSKYLSKGKSVFVEGRIQTKAWEDKTGQKRYTTEIMASNVQFMSPAGASTGAQGASSFKEPQGQYGNEPFYGGREPSLDSMDEIPF